MGTGRDVSERRYRVLVVDDDPMVATLVAEYLEHLDGDLSVTYTTAPTTALERLDDSFDCVVTDYEMPVMDGVTLVEQTDVDVGAVLYTATDESGVATAAKSVGAAYMRKRSNTDHYVDLAELVRKQAAT
ncbi:MULTISPECIES: response regulator [Haloarcula]|uniref:Response regulator n=1 Tax=Haloarcula pellucida TaxID=1427151 RepID=A0A830GQG2_9EURY|nr:MULTISPECIES: response regulator [Halomicroarcula]MBX0349568.1 response regulator [Halomicroarcula pellucida]MDS0278847.1 response regulator [Halomicroarcula sp. S1AR25-4]GGO02329.1 response regulator [Halomicroarcula pellucida]